MKDWGALSYDWADIPRYLSELAHHQDLPAHILCLFWFSSSRQGICLHFQVPFQLKEADG